MQERLSILANISRKCVKQLPLFERSEFGSCRKFSAEMSSRLIRDGNSDWNIFIILFQVNCNGGGN
ncbi:MAG: hypothetical protein GX783_07255 [Clostridiales bacterium]|nr:hypothetical protein [Clostridiales bacterium]